MLRRVLPALAAAMVLVGSACAADSEADTVQTVFIQFDHVPTAADEAAIRAIGGSNLSLIPLARAITVRTSRPPTEFSSLPGVERIDLLGADPDPIRSWFIVVVSDPTAADTAFVRAAGARTVGILRTSPRTIAAEMRPSQVRGLAENPRFVFANMGFDNANVPDTVGVRFFRPCPSPCLQQRRCCSV